MDVKEVLRQDNWKQLHNSLLQNIKIASEELESLYEQKESIQKSVDGFELLKQKEREKIITIKNEVRGIYSELEKKKQYLTEKEIEINKTEKEIEKLLVLVSKKNLEEENRVKILEAESRDLSNKIYRLLGEEENVKEELDKARKQFKKELKETKEIIIQEMGKTEVLQKISVSLQEEIKEKQKESAKLNNTIVAQQKNVGGFKEKWHIQKKEMRQKHKDLKTLEERLRVSFKELNRNFKL